MKRIPALLALALCCLCTSLVAQPVYMTKTGTIRFFSSTPLENIDAVSKVAFSALDTEKGDLAFSVSIKSFHFERSLMEEHFNENYMETERYPKSTFSGKIQNIKDVNLKKDGRYPVQVTGDLTIHGVTQKVTVPGEIQVTGPNLHATAKFIIALADYKVTIPSIVAQKIAERLEITIDCLYEPKK